MSSVSWIILTHNRAETVNRAIRHCMANSGAEWDEIVWIDNGSAPGEYGNMARVLAPLSDSTVHVRYETNRGVARGYNTGMGLATCDYIVITGCDMLMPDGWLKTFKEYVTKIPETGVACIYSSHWTARPARLRTNWGIQHAGLALPIVHAMPIERRIFKRSFLADFGYFPESFGLYGFDDLAWAARVEKVCTEKGLLTYVIPDMVAEHLGDEGIEAHAGRDSKEYHAMKRREVEDPAKRAELNRLRSLGWPRFSPFL